MYLEKYKIKVDNLLNDYLSSIKNEEFKTMLKYSIDGGKRLRPIICLYLFDKFGIKNNDIVIGIEFLHCASLILDDLPCMDNDDIRRNRLTFHKKYGIKKGYIVANYLFTEFNKFVLMIGDNKIINYIFDNLILIVKGQYYDLGFVKNDNLSNDKIIYNNNLKTYPFFVLSFIIPFFLINKFEVREDVEYLALSFSTAFQIYDDFIDYDEDVKNNNFNHIKIIGKKKTYKMYKDNIEKFNILCIKYEINSELFNEIINYLNDNLQLYINEL